MSDQIIQTAGDVRLKKMTLVSSRGKFINLLDYLVEFNLYESIFSPTMTGSITVGDARNLIRTFPILGEEIVSVIITTPGTETEIEKIFRVYSIVERNYVGDGSKQVYTLQFCSIEMMRDISNPLYRSFNGKPSDIVRQIYADYLQVSRTLPAIDSNSPEPDTPVTDLAVFSETKNIIKFVSPGWTPIKCIDWLCAHSEPSSSKASNFLFWETNKRFYFGTVEDILANKSKLAVGPSYVYSPALINSKQTEDKKMYTIRDIHFKKIFDQVENKTDGFLSSRVINVNPISKTYENFDYDYTDQFYAYSNLSDSDKAAFPLHDTSTSRNPRYHSIINYDIPGLYGTRNNFSERKNFLYGNRRSNLLKLQNLEMRMVIPGRTDLEAGSIINIDIPRGFPAAPDEVSKSHRDDMYSGYYMVTSINHKVNLVSHYITMTVTKDSIVGNI